MTAANFIQYGVLASVSRPRRAGTAFIPDVMFSDADADLRLVAWSVNKDGYAKTSRRNADGKLVTVYAHRIVLSRKLGRPLTSKDICDHIDRHRQNNTRDNLRRCTVEENRRNSGRPARIINGVHWNRFTNKWHATVRINGRDRLVRRDNHADAAAVARDLRERFDVKIGCRRKKHQASHSHEQQTSEQEGSSYKPAPTGRTSPTPIDDAHSQVSVMDGSSAHGGAFSESKIVESTLKEAAPCGVTFSPSGCTAT